MSKATLNQLGSYRLLSLVNTSRHCQIWKAYSDSENRPVAIKTLVEQFRQDRQYIALLKREFTVGSGLVHPRIIRIHEYAVDRGVPFISMEWFPGANLKTRIYQGAEAIASQVPQIVVQATEAVAVFNGEGWIHRDIKPENFLVSDEGEVKLIDFALAQRRKGLLGRLFSTKSKVQGTRSYISPEQIRGEALDQRADLYSLACTLFELIAGRPPYTGVNTNELLTKHLRATPPLLETVRPDVNPEFSQLVRSAMAKYPMERPHSTEEFYQRLVETPVFRRTYRSPRSVNGTPR